VASILGETEMHAGARNARFFAGGGIVSKREWTEVYVCRILTNPFYCLTADPTLAHPHEPIISEEQWIDAAVKMIEAVGVAGCMRCAKCETS
jgi:hypothetical protein